MKRLCLLLALASVACAGSWYGVQARIADGIARAANAAGPIVLAQRASEQRAAISAACPVGQPCDGDRAHAAVLAVRARWVPVLAAWESVRVAHDVYAAAIEACAQAASHETCRPSVESAALRFMASVTPWRCAMRAIGASDPIPGPVECGGAQ